MAAPQLMRCVLAKLAAPRTFEKGVFMSREVDSDLPPPPAAAAFQQRFEVVFVDGSGWLNIMAGVSGSALQHVGDPCHLRPSCCLPVNTTVLNLSVKDGQMAVFRQLLLS
jgi:hypothetical protein